MQTEFVGWKTVDISSIVSFAVPPTATVELEDDDAMVVVSLQTDPATDVLIGLFPLRQERAANPGALEKELRDFTARCIAPCADVRGESYSNADDVEFPGVICCQSVTSLANDRWWIARAYAAEGGADLLLVHWNGPQTIAKTVVLAIMTSLVPRFALRES